MNGGNRCPRRAPRRGSRSLAPSGRSSAGRVDTSNGPRLGLALVAPYLPKSMSGLVTFTQKVAELDLLLEPGDMVTLLTPGYATFVEDPILDRV